MPYLWHVHPLLIHHLFTGNVQNLILCIIFLWNGATHSADKSKNAVSVWLSFSWLNTQWSYSCLGLMNPWKIQVPETQRTEQILLFSAATTGLSSSSPAAVLSMLLAREDPAWYKSAVSLQHCNAVFRSNQQSPSRVDERVEWQNINCVTLQQRAS